MKGSWVVLSQGGTPIAGWFISWKLQLQRKTDDFWLVVWNMFFHILGIIIPTDFHIFQRGGILGSLDPQEHPL